MDERVQPLRRGLNFVMDAEQLDRQDSLARRDNKRVENRLRLEKGSLENHNSNNMYSLNYEMKRLKRELKGIKQTSGHFDLGNSKTSRTNRRARGKRTRGRSKTSPEVEREENAGQMDVVTRHNEKQHETCDEGNKNGQFLPVLCATSTVRSSRLKEEPSNSPANTADLLWPNAERSQRTRVNALDTNRIGKTEESVNDASKHGGYPPEIEMTSNLKNNHSAEKYDSSFGNLKMDTVKERIQNRLSTTNGQVSSYDASDYTPFMHVPPDGMPRTVYLLPPLQDLLKEAKKARYIRRPKAHLENQDQDDPERELDIDEIFGKKG